MKPKTTKKKRTCTNKKTNEKQKSCDAREPWTTKEPILR